MISQLQQFQHNADGSISIAGQPNIRVETIQEQDLALATAEALRLEKALGLPHFREDWERVAHFTGFSTRMFSFVLVDGSKSRLVGNPHYKPETITFPSSCLLEFAHRGFAIGQVSGIRRCLNPREDDLKALGVNVPVEGSCLLGQAQLFNSRLANKAWEAVQRGIFTHVCPLLFMQPHEPLGSGSLWEVSLVTGDYPGCRNARIIRTWQTECAQ